MDRYLLEVVRSLGKVNRKLTEALELSLSDLETVKELEGEVKELEYALSQANEHVRGLTAKLEAKNNHEECADTPIAGYTKTSVGDMFKRVKEELEALPDSACGDAGRKKTLQWLVIDIERAYIASHEAITEAEEHRGYQSGEVELRQKKINDLTEVCDRIARAVADNRINAVDTDADELLMELFRLSRA